MGSPRISQNAEHSRAWEQLEFTVNDFPSVILCLKVGSKNIQPVL